MVGEPLKPPATYKEACGLYTAEPDISIVILWRKCWINLKVPNGWPAFLELLENSNPWLTYGIPQISPGLPTSDSTNKTKTHHVRIRPISATFEGSRREPFRNPQAEGFSHAACITHVRNDARISSPHAMAGRAVLAQLPPTTGHAWLRATA